MGNTGHKLPVGVVTSSNSVDTGRGIYRIVTMISMEVNLLKRCLFSISVIEFTAGGHVTTV